MIDFTSWIYCVAIRFDMVMNVVTGSDDGFETHVVLVPGPAMEDIWVCIIPVKAQESSFFIFTDLAKQL